MQVVYYIYSNRILLSVVKQAEFEGEIEEVKYTQLLVVFMCGEYYRGNCNSHS